MKFETIKEVVSKEKAQFISQNPDIEEAIESGFYDFNRKFQELKIEEFQGILDLCPRVDQELDLSDIGIKQVSLRARILKALVEVLFKEKSSDVTLGEENKLKELVIKKELVLEIASLLPKIREGLLSGEIKFFNQKWIQLYGNGAYEKIAFLITDEDTAVPNWELFKTFLPSDIRDCFLISRRFSKEKKYIEGVKKYRDILEHLGPVAAAQVMVSDGLAGDEEFSTVIRVLTDYLEQCSPRKPTFADVVKYPAAVLQITEVRRVIFIHLRNYVYKRLVAKGFDDSQSADELHPEARKARFKELKLEIDKILLSFGREDNSSHKELFDEVIEYFDKALNLKAPASMVEHLIDEEGNWWTFPSHRQQIAMYEMERGKRELEPKLAKLQNELKELFKELEINQGNKSKAEIERLKFEISEKQEEIIELRHEINLSHRKLIAFFMGKGKTATAFLCKEHLNCKKMLWVCPPHLVNQTAARVEKYYKEGKKPSVGCITEGITADKLDEALTKDVVIFPYSMFSSHVKREVVQENGEKQIVEERIVNCVKKEEFDFMTVDEVQRARNPDRINTSTVYELATQIPGLYDHGYILQMSGEPFPNGPQDVVPYLNVYDNLSYGNVKGFSALVRNTHPVKLCNSLLDFLLLIDEPEDWEQYIKYEDFALYPEEREIYNFILENDLLEPQQKLQLLLLCVLNPLIFSHEKQVPSALFDKMAEKIDEYFFTPLEGSKAYDALVIAENLFKQGFTREHERTQSESMIDRIKDLYESKGFTVNIFLGDNKYKSLPKDSFNQPDAQCIDVFLIDGEADDDAYRQFAYNSAKRKGRKTILFCMSGTMREGINLSHVHRAIQLEPTYNKPDTAQLVKRFVREGNKDFELALLRAADTIHMGVFEHAEQKALLTNVLKYGGTFSDDDLALIRDENLLKGFKTKDRIYRLFTPIMKRILSSAEKLNALFSYTHNKGEELYKIFVKEYGALMAELYNENWETSYSANNARFVAGLFKELEEKGIISGNRYGDLASGPLVLYQTLGLGDDSRKRSISSLDINPEMLQMGKNRLSKINFDIDSEIKVGSIVNMKEIYPDGNFEAINCALSLNYTRLTTKTDLENSERVKTLLEYNRVLKDNGIMILTLPEVIGYPEERECFLEALKTNFGFKILDDYSGVGFSTDDMENHHFANYTIVCQKVESLNGPKEDQKKLDLNDLRLSRIGRKVKEKGRKEAKPIGSSKEFKGFIHTCFQLKNLRMIFDENIKKEAESQKEYVDRTEVARGFLQFLFKEYFNFENMPQEVQLALKRSGIKIRKIPYEGEIMYGFSFKDSPDIAHQIFDM